MEKNFERKRVLRIYQYLIAIICVSPLFELWEFLPSAVFRVVELICLMGTLRTVYLLHKSHSLVVNYKWFFILFFIYCAFIVFRGDWSSGIKDNVLLIIDDHNTLVYLLPFILLFLPNRKYFSDIINIFYKASLIVIPIWILNVNNLVQELWYGESVGVYLPFFSAFLLGLVRMQTKEKRVVTICIWVFYFLLMVLNARRNVCFSLALYAAIAYLFYMRKSYLARFWFVVGGLILSMWVVNRWEKLTKETFSRMYQRTTEETRGGVEEWFFMDMLAQPTSTWMMGKGMSGSYFHPMQDEDGAIETNRTVVETGYLHLILKGGILLVLFIVTLLSIAVVKGIRSSDMSIKYIALILLTYFIDFYTTNSICIFGVRSIILWFGISICFQSSVDNLQTQNEAKCKLIKR